MHRAGITAVMVACLEVLRISFGVVVGILSILGGDLEVCQLGAV